MSQIITQITPKWESEETVWGFQTKTDQDGGGYFYSSVLTFSSVVSDLQDKTGKELVTSKTLGVESISAANSFLETLFVENLQKDSSLKSTQIITILDMITVEDKNISSNDAFKNAILYRLSFEDVLKLLDMPAFSDEVVVGVLKNVLGLEKPIPDKDLPDCCECEEEEIPEEAEAIDEEIIGEPKPPREGPPPTATGPSGCDAIPRSTGIPGMKNSLLLCSLPDIKVDAIVSQTYKDWEDKELNENCTIRECASNQNKGDTKFVGSTIGPKKPPTSEPLLPPEELGVEDPDSSRSSGGVGPCGDIALIDSLPQAYQEILNKYGMRGLIKKAAQCAGMDLPILDIKEIMLMSFIKQLDCVTFVSLIDRVIDMTGLERGPSIVDFWGLEKMAALLKGQIRNVISSLPPRELEFLAQTPQLNLAPQYIGDIDPSVRAGASVKMPQQIEDIVDAIEQWSPQEMITFFENQNLFDKILYSVCEQDKGSILDQIVDILNQINLDDLGTPSVSLEFDETISDTVATIGSLYDKLYKIVQMGLGIEIPDFSVDLFNFDKFQMVPLGELPELPTVDLDLSPTIDLMASVSVGIANTIMESISEATLSMLKNTIKAVCESCEQGNIGDLDIGNLIGESAKSSFSPAKAQELKNSLVGSVKDILPTPMSYGEVASTIEELIDDVSGVLKPGQAGGLLLGEAPSSVLDAVRTLSQRNSNYSSILPAIQSDAQINRLFSNVGALVDKVLLAERISELTIQTSPFSPGKELLVDCESPQVEFERSELKKKGIPEEEIEKQLERKKERRKKKFSELADLLAQEQLMEGVVPEDECSVTPSGRKKPSLTPKEPPINDYLLMKTVDVIYDGTYMSFNKEVSSFPNAITTEVEEPTKLEDERIPPPSSTTPGEVNVLQQAQSGTVKVIAPDLKGFYESFAEGNTLLRNEDTKFVFTIPNKTGLDNSNQNYVDALSRFSSVDSLATQNSNTDFLISYDTFLTEDIGLERYNFSISSQDPQSQPVFSYESRDRTPILESVIKIREGFQNTPTFSPKTDFKKFIENAWFTGTGTTKDIESVDYDGIYKDIFINAGTEVATSDFFDVATLSLVDFAPQLSPTQKACGCTDPHLLDLESIKKKVIKEFEDSKCGKSISDANSQDAASPLDQASIGGVISTIIRVYLTEFCLQSLFVLSKFPLQSRSDKLDIVDTLVKSYFTTRIVKDIGDLDKTYSRDFQNQVILYHNKIAKENGWTKTGNVQIALEDLVSQQLYSVITRMLQILGVDFVDTSISKMFLERWTPLFDLPATEGEVRFFNAKHVRENNVPSAVMENITGSLLGGQVFDLEDGNMILERYITKNDKAEPDVSWDRGDVSLSRFKNILETDSRFQDRSKPLGNFFEGNVSLGLRLTYLPPVETTSTPPPPAGNTIAPMSISISLTPTEYAVDNKAYELEEKERVVIQKLTENQNQEKILKRTIVTIPLIDAERPLDTLSNMTVQQAIEQLNDLEGTWNTYSTELVEDIISQDAFEFLFNYCFPLQRMIFILMAYSSTYFSYNKKVVDLFTNTKEQLKSTFYTMLNVNDPTYEDETMRKIGGNKGLAALADNNADIPGIDLAGLIARTPLLILKGMAETSDPNITLAKKIHDAALMGDVDIPMVAASLLALPVNLIPPPFGIGPPITPIGMAYLATDAGSSLLSPKEQELRKKKILEESAGKVNLNEATNVDQCKEPEVDVPIEGVAEEPPTIEEPCEELCAGLANEVWLNILSSERRKYDRELLKQFQSCADIVVDGFYGPQTEAALRFYGPPNTPPKQYPRGGEFVIPECAGPQPPPPEPCGEPCYDLAAEVHTNITASSYRQYDRDLLKRFQTCAKIVVDGYYGPQTKAALMFYGPPNTPEKQYPTGQPFTPPDCEPSGPTEI